MRALPVLLTRPRADGDRVAAALRAAGVERVLVAPLVRIAPRGRLPDHDGGLLLTSANAVAAYVAAGGTGGRPAWTVGPRTAAAAAAAGLEVRGVADDAEALARLVPANAPPLLHLRGAIARGDLAGALRARGISASEAILYAQEALPLDAEAVALIALGPVLAPVYSPRGASLLMAACRDPSRANLRAVCLSRAVAAACDVPVAAVAARPDGAAMLDAVLAACASSAVEAGGRSV